MSRRTSDPWSITLTPHRSLGRTGFLVVMGLVVLVNLLAGGLFLALGAWPVLGFMGADVAIIWWVFRRNFADSARAEQISAAGDCLTLRSIMPTGEKSETVFNRRWVKVDLEFDTARDLVGRLSLRSHGEVHEIAAFLGAEERQSLARTLRASI